MKKTKLRSYLKPYWLFAILSPLLMIGEVWLDLMQPKLMSKIVNEGVLGQNISLIIETGLYMLFLVAIGGVMGSLCACTASIASQGFGNDLRRDTFSRVMSLSLEQTDRFTTGSLITRLTNDITTLQETVQMFLRMFVRAPIFLIGGLVMCLSLNVNFGYVMLISLPVQAIIVIVLIGRANPLFNAVQKKIDRVNAVVQENISGARVIKAYSREEYEIERFDGANTDYKNTNLRVMTLMSVLMPLLMIVMNLTAVVIIYIGGWQVEAQAMNVGDVMAAVQYVSRVLMSIMMVSMVFQQIARGRACADRVREVIVCEPAVKSGTRTDGLARGTVEFRHVGFRYPNAQGDEVLHDINLSIRQGETFAIIGATGSGKTSLVNRIPRFYDATEGEVLVDGRDVREWDLHALRSRISCVLQKSELFAGTVSQNITFGTAGASDEAIRRAADTAQATDFISGIPDGFNGRVAEKGTSLSGGQKQRMSIARAIVRDPEIIIFDDSTSALDLSTEAKLQAALHRHLSGATVILIAQRIASVQNADRIAVLENGTITACDTHENLMQTSETYRDIYKSQVKGDARDE